MCNYWTISVDVNSLLCSDPLGIIEHFSPVFTDILEKTNLIIKQVYRMCSLLCPSSLHPFHFKALSYCKRRFYKSLYQLTEEQYLFFRKGIFIEVKNRCYSRKVRFLNLHLPKYVFILTFLKSFCDYVFPECLPFLIISITTTICCISLMY